MNQEVLSAAEIAHIRKNIIEVKGLDLVKMRARDRSARYIGGIGRWWQHRVQGFRPMDEYSVGPENWFLLLSARILFGPRSR
jgi:hypothetical protein